MKETFFTLTGTDSYLKRHTISDLKSKIGSPLEVISNDTKQFASILDEMMMYSMMGTKRLFLIDQTKELTDKQQEALFAYIQNPTPQTYVVWILEKFDKRKKFYKSLMDQTQWIAVETPKLNQMSSWVDQLVLKANVKIARDAKPLLIDFVGVDVSRLEQEIQKLCLFIHPRTTIEKNDVVTMVLKLSGEDIFTCTDAIIEGNRKKAMETLHFLFESGVSPFAISTMLARHLRILLKLMEAKQKRISSNQMAAFVGVPPFTLSKYQQQTARYTYKKSLTVLKQLQDLDNEMKSIGIPQNRLLEKMVVSLVS